MNEAECVRYILLLADMEQWLRALQKDFLLGVSPTCGKLLRGPEFRISLAGLAHILERHFHSTLRHPATGKFLIPLAELIDLLKEAGSKDPEPMAGSQHLKREMECERPVGINRLGETSWLLVVIADARGELVTAYPG